LDRKDVEAVPDLKILAEGDIPGPYMMMANNGREFFLTGHPEYAPYTLDGEYRRDLAKGLPIEPPVNYYKDNDPEKGPHVRWRSYANLFYTNWLNYFVYQITPYDINLVK
jgi:homoserine O-succinyltransferase